MTFMVSSCLVKGQHRLETGRSDRELSRGALNGLAGLCLL
jgi:hypothetical protein